MFYSHPIYIYIILIVQEAREKTDVEFEKREHVQLEQTKKAEKEKPVIEEAEEEKDTYQRQQKVQAEVSADTTSFTVGKAQVSGISGIS